MKIKIVMDSGKEYTTENYNNVQEFAEAILGKPNTVNFISLDEEKKVYINTANISSFEILEGQVDTDEEDPLVYY